MGRNRVIGAALALALAPAAAGADVPVDLELVLAVDASASIEGVEVDLQRAGYVAALVDAGVVGAIRTGPLGRIAVAYIEWAGPARQQTVVDWRLIDGPASAAAFAAAIAAEPPLLGETTSISSAIDYAVTLFDDNGFAGKRRVIDVSADGRSYGGRDITAARDDAVAAGITINGLAINPRQETMVPEGSREGLDYYFLENVIGGPGAFIAVAETPPDFPRALRNKLVQEIAGLPPPRHAAAAR